MFKIAKNDFQRIPYDNLVLSVPVELKTQLDLHLNSKNESFNDFIVRAIQETINHDNTDETE